MLPIDAVIFTANLIPFSQFCWFVAGRVLGRLLKEKLKRGLLEEATAIMSEIEVSLSILSTLITVRLTAMTSR